MRFDPFLRIVVVNYNAGPHLAGVLRCLLTQTMQSFEVVVVDNGSTDDSFIIARALIQDDRFSFLAAPGNIGFAAANNLGAREAHATWIATLNPDAYPAPDWLAELRRATEDYPDIVVFGSTQLDFSHPEILDGCGDCYSFAGVPWRGGKNWSATQVPPDGEMFSACAAAAIYRRDVFEGVGGFAESYFCYVEDVEIGFRLRLQGYRCRQVSAAVVYHVGGVSSVGSSRSFALYYGMRNSIWTFVRCMPGILFWVFLPFHLAYLLLALASATRRGYPRPIIRGVAAGIGALPRLWRERRLIQDLRRVGVMRFVQMLSWRFFSVRKHPADRLYVRLGGG